LEVLVFVHDLQALTDKAFREFAQLSQVQKKAARVWMSVAASSRKIHIDESPHLETECKNEQI
jgi:hypothetical protein